LYHDTHPGAPVECQVSVQQENGYYCWLCSPGYVYDALNALCYAQTSNCVNYNDEIWECSYKCTIPCATCDSQGSCLSCIGNYVLSGGTC